MILTREFYGKDGTLTGFREYERVDGAVYVRVFDKDRKLAVTVDATAKEARWYKEQVRSEQRQDSDDRLKKVYQMLKDWEAQASTHTVSLGNHRASSQRLNDRLGEIAGLLADVIRSIKQEE